jgi:hypothetical protein
MSRQPALIDTSRAPSERDIDHARLPEAYQNAKQQLAFCRRVDECKTWADKAAALASYARQAKDKTLLNHALRIQARATRRAGQLLELFKLKQSPGRPKKNGSGAQPHSQKDTARKHGMSKHQERTAKRAAKISDEAFDAAVESDDPPTQEQLSQMGAKKQERPSPPVGFAEATHLLGALGRMVDQCEQHQPAFIVGGVDPREITKATEQANRVVRWLVEFVSLLMERADAEAATHGHGADQGGDQSLSGPAH